MHVKICSIIIRSRRNMISLKTLDLDSTKSNSNRTILRLYIQPNLCVFIWLIMLLPVTLAINQHPSGMFDITLRGKHLSPQRVSRSKDRRSEILINTEQFNVRSKRSLGSGNGSEPALDITTVSTFPKLSDQPKRQDEFSGHKYNSRSDQVISQRRHEPSDFQQDSTRNYQRLSPSVYGEEISNIENIKENDYVEETRMLLRPKTKREGRVRKVEDRNETTQAVDDEKNKNGQYSDRESDIENSDDGNSDVGSSDGEKSFSRTFYDAYENRYSDMFNDSYTDFHTYCSYRYFFFRPNKGPQDIAVLVSSFLGIACVLITLVVLTRKTMRTSCNSYLTALAVSDFIFLTLLIGNRLMELLEDCNFYTSDVSTAIKYYSYPLMGIFLKLTVGITVMLGFERYIAICRPMRAMAMCTVKRARICITILVFVAIILQSPKFFDLHFSYGRIANNETKLTVTHSYRYDNKLYCYIVTCGLVTILPLLLLIVLTTRIIYEIRKSARYLQVFLGADWQVRSVVSSEELKITTMLISVIVVFFICHVPYMVTTLLMALNEVTILIGSPTMPMAIAITQSLVAMKALCHLILYCWLSDKFWTTFKRTLRRVFLYTRRGQVPGRRQMQQTDSSNHSDLNSVHSLQNCQINSTTNVGGAAGNKRRVKWQHQSSSHVNFSRCSFLTKEAAC